MTNLKQKRDPLNMFWLLKVKIKPRTPHIGYIEIILAMTTLEKNEAIHNKTILKNKAKSIYMTLLNTGEMTDVFSAEIVNDPEKISEATYQRFSRFK